MPPGGRLRVYVRTSHEGPWLAMRCSWRSMDTPRRARSGWWCSEVVERGENTESRLKLGNACDQVTVSFQELLIEQPAGEIVSRGEHAMNVYQDPGRRRGNSCRYSCRTSPSGRMTCEESMKRMSPASRTWNSASRHGLDPFANNLRPKVA